MKLSLARTTLMYESVKYGEKKAVVYEHTKRTRDAVRRLGKIIQSIFCAQSGASTRLTVWKWSSESRYPGALAPVFENVRRAYFSSGPTDCPLFSEDDSRPVLSCHAKERCVTG